MLLSWRGCEEATVTTILNQKCTAVRLCLILANTPPPTPTPHPNRPSAGSEVAGTAANRHWLNQNYTSPADQQGISSQMSLSDFPFPWRWVAALLLSHHLTFSFFYTPPPFFFSPVILLQRSSNGSHLNGTLRLVFPTHWLTAKGISIEVAVSRHRW